MLFLPLEEASRAVFSKLAKEVDLKGKKDDGEEEKPRMPEERVDTRALKVRASLRV